MKSKNQLSISSINELNEFQKEFLGDFNLENLKLMSDYRGECTDSSFKDLTFLVSLNKRVVASVLCYKIEGILRMPSDGVQVHMYSTDLKESKKAYDLILEELHDLAVREKCRQIIVKDFISDSAVSVFGNQLLKHDYMEKIAFEMSVPLLNFDPQKYFQSIRKSYKSLINWGKKNLDVVAIDKDSPSIDRFMEFKAFHKKISERQTRSDKSWEIQYNFLSAGHGELLLAEYKGDLVAGSLSLNHLATRTYWTGVYERSLFNFGISHYLVYLAVCRAAKKSTTEKFSLGFYDTEVKDPKLNNIQFFKKGFCQTLTPHILWKKELS